ncbi:hypothetical protein ACBG90_20780 [Stutzerimonas kunmingensis]
MAWASGSCRNPLPYRPGASHEHSSPSAVRPAWHRGLCSPRRPAHGP